MNMNGAEDGAEKGAGSKVQNDKHVLLGNDAHMVVDMLDHWNDGILSIGTIAISPLEASSPLMNVEFFSHELEKVIGADHEIIEEEVVENVVELKDTNCDVNEDEGQTKRRVTLADLFLEDSDYHPPASRAKNGISKAKNLIKEDLHPLKKFNKLMKRMMKKKIHPDFEGKTQKRHAYESKLWS
uniref:Protein TILLER ANGLE CONTROL 1 n=1 Tax=Chenopodium quinoa TaxID=63459 RepID=A0A803MPC3_CHEQI